MSLDVVVDAAGTVVAVSPAEARRITDQIKFAVDGVWQLITRAYTARAWDALGYGSWDEYCTREFGTARLRLPREERAEVVASLRDSGLSLRAIAAATGESKDTVARALTAGVSSETPAPLPPAPKPIAEDYDGCFDSPDGDQLDAAEWECPEPQPAPTPRPIIGIDGKTYTPPAPRPVPERDAAEDERQARIRRRCAALVKFLDGWTEFHALVKRTHPERDDVLAALNEFDREAVLRIERSITWI